MLFPPHSTVGRWHQADSHTLVELSLLLELRFARDSVLLTDASLPFLGVPTALRKAGLLLCVGWETKMLSPRHLFQPAMPIMGSCPSEQTDRNASQDPNQTQVNRLWNAYQPYHHMCAKFLKHIDNPASSLCSSELWNKVSCSENRIASR